MADETLKPAREVAHDIIDAMGVMNRCCRWGSTEHERWCDVITAAIEDDRARRSSPPAESAAATAALRGVCDACGAEGELESTGGRVEAAEQYAGRMEAERHTAIEDRKAARASLAEAVGLLRELVAWNQGDGRPGSTAKARAFLARHDPRR